ncbi:hypothetical protein Droror1_Dr00019658 [Drosera rotundifolia]
MPGSVEKSRKRTKKRHARGADVTLASSGAKKQRKISKVELAVKSDEPEVLDNDHSDMSDAATVDSTLSESDQEHDDGETNANSAVSTSKSSFTLHVDRELSKQEIDSLSTKKWKYKWEIPAFDEVSKWLGTGESFLQDADASSAYGLKLRLYEHWLEVYKGRGGGDFHSSKERLFFFLCNSYRDILHHNKKAFYNKGMAEDSSFMDAYIMHTLNHVFRSGDLVKKNDAKLAKHEKNVREEVLTSDSFLDHGFTRPKVLMLLPLKSIAHRVVKRLIQLTPTANKVNVDHLDRFDSEFGIEAVETVDRNESLKYDHVPHSSKTKKLSKPQDFNVLFGGNNSDSFMVGVKFTRKSIKVYNDFYSSDLIVASPVGLYKKLELAEKDKQKDVDYLSSIEILVIDHADVISMQNWSLVNEIAKRLNHLPSNQHGTDIMRIRKWYLDGQAQFYRQTIILSSYLTPDINALFNHHCVNFEGKIKLSCKYKGVLPKIIPYLRQIYERFDLDSIVGADDARFEYFKEKVFPKIKDSDQVGVMIFVASYHDYLRLRRLLRTEEASHCLLGEYAEQKDISNSRRDFFEGKSRIIVYTERAHFYHRYKIRGVQNLILYSLPERKELYPEIVNKLKGSENMTCTVLCSRFDLLQLERIVGSAGAKRMLSSDKHVFVVC